MKLMFWLYRSKMNRKGLSPLFMRITINGSKTEMSTGLHITSKQWNAKTGLIKGSTAEVSEMNKRIGLLRTEALKVYHSLVEQQLPVTAEFVKSKILEPQTGHKTLLEAVDYHNQLIKSQINIQVSSATITKYESLKSKLSAFIRQYQKREDVYLLELNHQFVIEFEAYLKVDGLSHNTTVKYIQFLKKIIHLAVSNGWMKNSPFGNYKCSLIHSDRGYLTLDELKRITNLAVRTRRMAVVKDMFLFSCYTGLSYADMKKLSCKHFETKTDGKRWIVLNRTKTGIRSAIPLLPQAIQILDRYEPPFFPDHDTPILPVISNQKMNQYLKELATACRITKRLTFHLGRHTFSTTITLTNGVPIESVSKMLGHSSLKTTQIYSKVVDTKVAADMLMLTDRLAIINARA